MFAPVVNRFARNEYFNVSNVNVSDFSVPSHKNFYYKGKLERKNCCFKIDTGSDVSLVNERFIDKNKKRLAVKEINLKYPTGERVPFKSRVLVNIQIGGYSLDIPMFVMT